MTTPGATVMTTTGLHVSTTTAFPLSTIFPVPPTPSISPAPSPPPTAIPSLIPSFIPSLAPSAFGWWGIEAIDVSSAMTDTTTAGTTTMPPATTATTVATTTTTTITTTASRGTAMTTTAAIPMALQQQEQTLDILEDPCGFERDFEKRVIVTLTDVPMLSKEEIYHNLEFNFIEVYIDIDCGDQQLYNVTIESEFITPLTGQLPILYEFRYVTKVQGFSRASSANVTLFSEDANRRRAYQKMTGHHHSLQGPERRDLAEDSCLCPPPSKEKFLASYAEKL